MLNTPNLRRTGRGNRVTWLHKYGVKRWSVAIADVHMTEFRRR